MKALVTGGGGFLGSRIAQMLHDRGDEVMVLGRRTYPHIEKHGISCVQADLRDATSVAQACRGMDVIFHAGALAGIWGRRKDFQETNVVGTQNVIDACRTYAVSKLVYTSSPSVVFGKDALCGVDESQPYPNRYLADYPATKAEAEKAVLRANGPQLATVSLRPHLIWGPGDPHLIPRVIERARQGKLMRIGDGKNLVDIIYIDNAADAHLRAADRLDFGAACAGRAYFLSQGEPVVLWDWLAEILRSIGVPPVKRSVSYPKAYCVGAMLEACHRMIGSSHEPRMTRFLASQLAKSHYFDISAARRDLGYEASVSTKLGMERLNEWLLSLHRIRPEPASTPPAL